MIKQLIVLLVGIALISVGVINFIDTYVECEIECGGCTGKCLDSDPTCGDFGTYHLLFILAVGITTIGCLLLFISFFIE